MANNRGYIGHGVQHTRFLSSSMNMKTDIWVYWTP